MCYSDCIITPWKSQWDLTIPMVNISQGKLWAVYTSTGFKRGQCKTKTGLQIAVCKVQTRGRKQASDCRMFKCVVLPFPSLGADHKQGNWSAIQANLSDITDSIFSPDWRIAMAIFFQLKLFLFNTFCLTYVVKDILHYAGFLFTQNGGWIP